MTKHELKRAWELAQSKIELPIDHLNWAIGFGLRDYKPVHVTIESLASLMRYQCACLDGSWDMTALDEIAQSSKKFIVIN